jgi:DNA-binding CsgD family transcriptional regulator
MRTAGRTQLLEREAELDALRRALEAAVAGRGTIVVVEGEAGIGKSALLGAVGVEARDRGVSVLAAAGHALERDLGFAVMRALLTPALAVARGERERRLTGAAGPAAQVLAPGDGMQVLDPAVACHALHWLCRNLAEDGPLALIVDDAHWADEPSLRALAYLARRLDDVPVLLVLARRTGEADARAAPLEGIAATPGAILVRPPPLSEAAVADLLAEELPEEADPALTQACHRAAAGNPFLTRELLAALRREDVPATPDAVGQVSPPAVARWVGGRLARLPADARALAESVAIFPAGTTLRHAAAVARLDLDAAGDAADVLADAEILRSARPLDFRHPLVRAAVHEAIAPSARAAAHARAAQVLQADGARPERVAFHVGHADPRADDGWVVVLLDAARAALAGGAPDAALRFCRRALAEPPAPHRRWTILHELGRAAAAVAWHDAQGALAEAVEAAPDIAARGRSLLLWTHAWGVTGGDRARLRALVDETLPALGVADPGLAARLRLKRRLLLTDDELDAELAAAADRADERTLEGRTTIVQWASRQAGAARCAAPEAAALVRRALAAGSLVDWEDPSTAHHYALAFDTLRLAGHIDEAEQHLRAAIRTAASAGDDYIVAMGMAMAADYALERGDLAHAHAQAEAGREIAERRGPRMLAVYQTSGVLAAVAIERGDVAAARRALSCLEDPAAPPAMARMAATAHAATLLAGGDPAAAAARALAHGRGEWAGRVANPALDGWRTVAAEALARQGDQDGARGLAHEQLALAMRWGAPAPLGEAHRVAARHAGRPEDAEGHLNAALEQLRPTHARLALARTLADHGGRLRRSRRRTEARQALREALAIAQECGAHALGASVEEELRAAGGRPRRLAQRGVDALTPSELRVCRLAAEGLSNREIAQTLFVTLRTVEGHLTAAYAKLGIAGRGELGDALTR